MSELARPRVIVHLHEDPRSEGAKDPSAYLQARDPAAYNRIVRQYGSLKLIPVLSDKSRKKLPELQKLSGFVGATGPIAFDEKGDRKDAEMTIFTMTGGKLEPVEAKATVLVCDIEGFAMLTDTLGAHRVIEFLNAYFETVVGIVERHGGTITQFQGDAILAVFNVPIADRDQAANALRAAIEIVRAADERLFAGVRTRNRIGLSTGRVVAGAVGSQGRLSYTVHGNAVNLAARLEALNKDYGTRILLSGKTAERCPGFELKKLGDVEVRGYGEPLELFTPAL